MSNSIALAKKYVPMLDEVYKKASTSSILERDSIFIRDGANVNEVLLPKIAVAGLGTYTKDSGYTSGDTSFSWSTYSLSQDRGRSLEIDNVDNMEIFDMGIGAISSEFIRTRVVPEVDAYRYAQLASLAGNTVSADLTSATFVDALDTAIATMGDSEVGMEGNYLFMTYDGMNKVKNSTKFSFNFETTGQDGISRQVKAYEGIPIVLVPQTRFYTDITLYDGSTAGQEDGGYIKNVVTGKNINFMIVNGNASMPVTKLAQPKLHNPADVVGKDSWVFEYRLYHDIIVPDNKVDGVYLHSATA